MSPPTDPTLTERQQAAIARLTELSRAARARGVDQTDLVTQLIDVREKVRQLGPALDSAIGKATTGSMRAVTG